MTEHFDQYVNDFDRVQPVINEMYRFLHQLALDLVPFEPEQSFRLADIGCGTGNFLSMALERFPSATAFALDESEQMLSATEAKLADDSSRVHTIQHDLNETLPGELADLDVIVAFSVFHHLLDQRKRSICNELYKTLNADGTLLIVDSMYVTYSDDVSSRWRRREQVRQESRLAESGISLAEFAHHEHAKHALDETLPARDRISTLDEQLAYLRDAGFSEIDRIWHFWMEHLLVARK